MLVDLPEVKGLLSKLRREFEEVDLNSLYPAYLARIAAVSEWRFSTGDYYHHEPFFEERGGFTSPVLVKKRFNSMDEARWAGKYCAGFTHDRHVITVVPGSRAVKAVQATLYDEVHSARRIQSISFKWFGKPERMQSQVRGLGEVISRVDNSKLIVEVGRAGAFSINLYQCASDGRPLSVQAFSNGWPSEDTMKYLYTSDGRLDQITAGGLVPIWKRKES